MWPSCLLHTTLIYMCTHPCNPSTLIAVYARIRAHTLIYTRVCKYVPNTYKHVHMHTYLLSHQLWGTFIGCHGACSVDGLLPFTAHTFHSLFTPIIYCSHLSFTVYTSHSLFTPLIHCSHLSCLISSCGLCLTCFPVSTMVWSQDPNLMVLPTPCLLLSHFLFCVYECCACRYDCAPHIYLVHSQLTLWWKIGGWNTRWRPCQLLRSFFSTHGNLEDTGSSSKCCWINMWT